jgi:KDZ transposase-like protein
VFGRDLALGYDIGCRFKTTLANSPLGNKARENNHRCLVGAFHGHAHNRLCQSQFLATYVKGLGLEDLEGCERFFSKSNALAGSTRYTSAFHRRQAIAEYAMYFDKFETYQNLIKYQSILHLQVS